MLAIIKQEKKFLIFLLTFSFLVRFLTFYFYLSKDKNYWQIDSDSYQQVAVNMFQGKGITTQEGKPNFYRLPGYPFFISLYYRIYTFLRSFDGTNELKTTRLESLMAEDRELPVQKNVLYPQIFLASLIPILIFFLSLVLFPGWLLLAKLASFYSSIHLGLILYSGFFMTETLFIFLFLLFALFLFYSFKVLRPRFLFIAGLFLGLASLVRPVGQYFIVLSVLLLLISSVCFAEKLKRSLVLTLGWLIPVSFWLIRNFVLTGSIFFHTLPGIHFLNLSAARVAMHVQNCSYLQARKNLNQEAKILIKQKEKEAGRKVTEIEKCRILEKLSLHYFIKHPWLALKNWMTDILRTSFSLYSAQLLYLNNGRKQINYFAKSRTIWDMFKRYLFPKTKSLFLKIIIWFEIITFFFLLLGLLFGFVQLFFNFKTTGVFFNAWIKALPLALLFIILALAGGYARMRLPAEPFLIILSFSFWAQLFYKYLPVMARANN